MADQPLILNALRRSDLLTLSFECFNLQLVEGGRLERVEQGSPAIVIVHFPGQHLAEQAFMVNAAGQGAFDPPPVRTGYAGGSRLAFQLPDDLESLPATLEGLLTWKGWHPILAPTALPRDYDPDGPLPPLAAPGENETAIEFPYRLFLSPDPTGDWQHDQAARELNGRYELWQTRLVQRQAAEVTTPPQEGGDLRAIDWVKTQNTFTTSLSLRDREQIVRLSSDFNIRPGIGSGPLLDGISEPERQARVVMLRLHFHVPDVYRPLPIGADRFSLSTLGASARLHGRWEFPVLPPEVSQALNLPVISLQRYEHIAGLGRDQYVKTVRVGVLCGTGHRAALVKVSERRFVNFGQAGTAPEGYALFGAKAYLHQYYQVVVQEPYLDYRGLSLGYANKGLEMPLRSIRLTTLVTPPIDPPIDLAAIEAHIPAGLDPQEHDRRVQDGIEAALQRPFWIKVLNQNFMFQATAEDADGHLVSFPIPLMFVPIEALGNDQAIRTEFDAGGPQTHTLQMSQQMVAVAPSENRPGSTHLKTASLTYDIEQPTLSAKQLNAQGLPTTYVARFLPWVSGILAGSPALEELTGSAAPVALRLDEKHYLANGFDDSQSFVSLVSPISYAMGAQKGGGLAGPVSKVEALSRSLGPTAAPDALAAGKVDISAFAGMKILGLLDIKDFLLDNLPFTTPPQALPPSEAELDLPGTRWNAPSLTTRRLFDAGGNLAGVETRYLWKPQLKAEFTVQPDGILTLGLQAADLLLDARLTRWLPSGGPDSNGSSMVVRGRLRQATLSFKDAVAVHFEELSFRAEDGRKMDVSASGVDLTFLGPLEFVNTLRKIMPSNGFSDPPFVNVDAQGISAGYTLGIPSVGVGIFSLQNISLGATLSIPFSDKPAGVRFAISERHKPFLVTVTLFGGGGFFGLAVSARGLEQVEAAIEFGGSLSLNLGVASGGVYVMAGIYFNLTKSSIELTGYLRCGGYLEVLGLISISIEFYLSFTYLKKAGQGTEVWGQATVTVCVKIAFFSKSVSMSVERHFAGSDGDPTFGQTHSEEQWNYYLQAFGI